MTNTNHFNRENSFTFERVLFFGRTLKEYKDMFNLDLSLLKGKQILDCPSGPASFIAEANAQNINAIGIDPVYENSYSKIQEIILTDLNDCCNLQEQLPHLAKIKRDMVNYRTEKEKAISIFLNDYELGLKQSRYLPYKLPNLPFKDNQFDLVLSSNFLFLYSDYKYGGMHLESKFDLAFHQKAILELIRVSHQEVRIFPLKGPHCNEHEFLQPILNSLESVKVNFLNTNYADLFGANHVLQILKS